MRIVSQWMASRAMCKARQNAPALFEDLVLLCDLDGTLADTRWCDEGSFDNLDRKRQAEAVRIHKPISLTCAFVLLALGMGCRVYYITARSGRHRRDTIKWLKQYQLWYPNLTRLYNRGKGKHIPAADYKEQVFRKLFADNDTARKKCIGWIEDDPAVIERMGHIVRFLQVHQPEQ